MADKVSGVSVGVSSYKQYIDVMKAADANNDGYITEGELKRFSRQTDSMTDVGIAQYLAKEHNGKLSNKIYKFQGDHPNDKTKLFQYFDKTGEVGLHIDALADVIERDKKHLKLPNEVYASIPAGGQSQRSAASNPFADTFKAIGRFLTQ